DSPDGSHLLRFGPLFTRSGYLAWRGDGRPYLWSPLERRACVLPQDFYLDYPPAAERTGPRDLLPVLRGGRPRPLFPRDRPHGSLRRCSALWCRRGWSGRRGGLSVGCGLFLWRPGRTDPENAIPVGAR